MTQTRPDISGRVEEILALTDRLIAIIRQETEHLRTRRAKALEETAEEKARLSSLYAKRMEAISRDRSLIAGAGAPLLARLKALTADFRAALEEHGTLLARAQKVSEGLIQAIGEELGARRRTVTGYGRDAAMRSYGAPAAGSLAFNRTV